MSRSCHVYVAAVVLAALGSPAGAQTPDVEILPFGESTKTTPETGVPTQLPQPETPGIAATLDRPYDSLEAFKNGLSNRYKLDISLYVSLYDQFATSNGGKPVALLVYYPNIEWRPFVDAPIGSGVFRFSFGQQQYWTAENTGVQAARMGLITYPNDWTANNYSWSTLAYTHTLPGVLKVVSFTVGQYNLFEFDPNAYAGNAQVNFISYPFAQDATQTFANAGLGGYATVKAPDRGFALSAGFQGATDLAGREITASGLSTGKVTYWGNFQWLPEMPGLGRGIYSLLYYHQPALATSASGSSGISFSASQQIGARWGSFVRVSNASGAVSPITTSVAFGVLREDPFQRDLPDEAGLALGWDKTNLSANGVTLAEARVAEWVSEVYYTYTIFKGLQITPDAQVFFHPALETRTSAAAVFSIRSTLSF